MEDLIRNLILTVLIGVALYYFNTKVTRISNGIKELVNVLVVGILILWWVSILFGIDVIPGL